MLRDIPLIPVAAMAAVVIASNVLVQYPFAPLGLADYLTWGAFSYPFAFLVTDLTNRHFGPGRTRRVVYVGFVLAVLASALLSTPRIALASGLAFLASQLLDVAIFHAFRQREWWRAPLTSTFVSSSLDTLIFFSLAFSAMLGFIFPAGANEAAGWAQDLVPLLNVGPAAPLWVSLALADLGVKIALALITMVPYRLITMRLQQRVSRA